MFPLADENPTGVFPYVTWGIIAVCILIFGWQITLPENSTEALFLTYGAIPSHVFSNGVGVAGSFFPAEATLVSSQFLHGGFGHIVGNMLYLYIFGDNIEAAIGRLKFLAFYLLCGIAAALGHALMVPQSDIPMIGASGAISGVLGAYLLLYPYAKVRVLFLPLPIPIFRVFYFPAVMVLGIWFVIQFVSAAATSPEGGGIAFWAHVAGFAAGLILLPLFKRRGIAYWQPAASTVFDARSRWGTDRAREKGPDREGADPDMRPRSRGPWGRRSDKP